jgi:pyridoxamine 5'-phosphate oxidase
MGLFKVWFDEAHAAKQQPNPNCMTLATVDGAGNPSARIVLCRGMDVETGHIVFFTNYRGRKGREVLATGKASVVFHWDHTDRQVRMEGYVVQSPHAESDAYFASRPWESRLSAWCSEQSEPIASREDLTARIPQVMSNLQLSPQELLTRGNAVHIPRPPHWGGFRLWCTSVELWLGGPGRLHDRAVWTRNITMNQSGPVSTGTWACTRLCP